MNTSRGIIRSALACSVALISACSTAASPSASVMSQDRCTKNESFSGRTVVGSPGPAAPTAALIPVPEGGSLQPATVYPTLASVTIDNPSSESTDITYAFAGDGVVGWTVRFIQAGFLRGTDTAVDVAGTCLLQIDLSGVADDEPASITPKRVVSADATEIVEVLQYPSSANLAQSFVGTRSGNPTVSVAGPSGLRSLALSFALLEG